MAYVAITEVLTIIGNFKLVVLDDQWISMAHVEFEISSDDGGEFGCMKTVDRMISVLQQFWQAGAATRGTSSWRCSLGTKS